MGVVGSIIFILINVVILYLSNKENKETIEYYEQMATRNYIMGNNELGDKYSELAFRRRVS